MAESLCSIPGCGRPRWARGWCNTHYAAWRRNGDPLIDRRPRKGRCSIPGCNRLHKGHGLCDLHYQRLKFRRDLLAPVRHEIDISECIIDEQTARIPLWSKDGQIHAWALIDKEDFAWLNQWHWTITPRGYVNRRVTIGINKQTTIYMHRQILGLPHGDPHEADHINRNKLDNRRVNLRIVTRGQNAQNLDSRGTTSPFRGVCWDRGRKKWMAYAGLNGCTHYLGHYDNEEEAAAVAAEFRRKHMPFSEEALRWGITL